MNDNNIGKEENHPEQEQIAALNDRASATTAEIIKQGLQRAPEDVLKGRKIYKINRTAFQSKTPAAAAAASVTGTSVAATTNGTTTPSSCTTTTTTDNKNDDTTIKTDDDNDKKSASTAGPSTTTTTNSDPFAATREDDEDDEDNEDVDHEGHDINSNSDSDSDDEQSLLEDDQLAEQIAATATAAEVRRQRVQLIIVLTLHDEFHLRTRNIIDVLVDAFLTIPGMVWDSDNSDNPDDADDADDADGDDDADDADDAVECRRQRVELISILKQNNPIYEIDGMVEVFLTRTKDDLHDMLCDNKVMAPAVEDVDDDGYGYGYYEVPAGEDVDDDDDDDDDDRYYRGLDSDRDTEAEVETALRIFPEVLSRRGGPDNMYPIQYLAIGCLAVSFIPLLVRLALELGSFEEKERGGLLLEDKHGDNILQFLVGDNSDVTYLNVMIQLRQMGVFKKDDIQKYGLVVVLCRCRIMTENRFRFLVEWDPTSLIQLYEYSGHCGSLPLHYATNYTSTIQDFRMVFEYGIRYYPKKKGISLLFLKEHHFNRTAFQIACRKFKYKQVMKVVEDILIRYSDTPINITEALITAASDEDIHLDCVYFLLRREPDIVKLESNDNNLSAPLPFGGTAPTPGMGGFGGGPSQTPGMGGFGGGGTTLTPTPGGFGGGGFGQQAPPQQQAQAGGFGNTTFNAQAGGQFSLGTGPATGSRRILKARRPR